MLVDASLTLQVGYYNSRLALWEPLIEPVAVTNETKTAYVPWELKLEVPVVENLIAYNSCNIIKILIYSSPVFEGERCLVNQYKLY